MNTNFFRYNNDVTDLEVGDMVKVTRIFDNPYCYSTMKYNANLKTESFWTEVVKLNNDGTMKVKVDNNCCLSDTNEEKPLMCNDTIVFQEAAFIKEHQKKNSEDFERTANAMIHFLNSFPFSDNERVMLSKMSNVERVQFISAITESINMKEF
tara:strand:+ start:2479 stop:2937 length:459 start_codon:yes stop_codon:yes gene_type:complete